MSDSESVSDVEVEDQVQVQSEEEEEERPQGVTSDPYLLEDAEYIKSETRWRNKQRTLVFASRGVDGRHRHLLEDLRKLMPHHKTESKFEKKESFTEINEICELKSCNNCVFIEARRHAQHCYLWVARIPTGPTIKFQILNTHTSAEVKMSGNCLLGSRPFLVFDDKFDDKPHTRLMKELLMQTFGTPRNHPKSKPFFDHVASFHILDGKIWFRHYQVSPDVPENMHEPEHQQLTEIGPRFVLDPIMILEGSFSGRKIYQNPTYMSPLAARRAMRMVKADGWKSRILTMAKREKHKEKNQIPEDPLDDTFA